MANKDTLILEGLAILVKSIKGPSVVRREYLEKLYKTIRPFEDQKTTKEDSIPLLDFDHLHDLARKYAETNADSCSRDRYLGLHSFIRWLKENGVETKGNPVPSLDKIKCHIANILIGIGLGEMPVQIDDSILIEKDFSISEVIDALSEHNYLQNGVETDKEQPMKIPTHAKIIKGNWFRNHGDKWHTIQEIDMYMQHFSTKDFAWVDIEDCIFKYDPKNVESLDEDEED